MSGYSNPLQDQQDQKMRQQMQNQPQSPQNSFGGYPAPNFSSTQPYAYNMNDMAPPSMGLPASPTLPPLYPSLMTPQLNPGQNSNLQQQRYAAGGSAQSPDIGALLEALSAYQGVQQQPAMPRYAAGGHHKSLKSLAERLRRQGQGGDTVLAHITPEEEYMLNMGGPQDINPRTGLPQHGKFFKKALRFVAPLLGGAIAGPLGAGLGGALGAGVSGGNPLTGGLMGYGLHGLTGNIFGGAPGAGLFGGAGSAGSAAANTGILGGLGNLFGGAAAPAAAAKAGAATAGGSGLFGGFGGGLLGGGLGSLLPLLLIGGALGAKKKSPDSVGSIAEAMAQTPKWGPEHQYHKATPTERVRRILTEEDFNRPGAPGIEFYEDSNPAPQRYMEGGLIAPEYAHGGMYSGGGDRYLDGHTDGQADKIPAQLSDGEFVVSADVVSSLGDGNNKAGAKKLYNLQEAIRKHKAPNMRKGKLPPKAKSLEHYMQGRS